MQNQTRGVLAGDCSQIFAAIDDAAKNDLARAAQLAQHILGLGHVDARLFQILGRWKKSDGHLHDALADLQQAHALAPGSAKILCELAECLNALGRFRLAIMAASDALAIDDTLAAAWFHRAFAHQLLGQPDRARDCYCEAIRRDPGMAAAHAQIANIHVLQGRYDEARAAAGQALAHHPGDAIAMTAIARADIAQRHLVDAERHVSWLVDQDDAEIKAIALGLLGDLRDAQDRMAEAFEAYLSAGSLSHVAYARHAVFSQERGSDQIRRMTRVLAGLPAPGRGIALR